MDRFLRGQWPGRIGINGAIGGGGTGAAGTWPEPGSGAAGTGPEPGSGTELGTELDDGTGPWPGDDGGAELDRGDLDLDRLALLLLPKTRFPTLPGSLG